MRHSKAYLDTFAGMVPCVVIGVAVSTRAADTGCVLNVSPSLAQRRKVGPYGQEEGAKVEYADSWLFVGADGLLYAARYDVDGHWNFYADEDTPNGWTVEHVRLEYWSREFPR